MLNYALSIAGKKTGYALVAATLALFTLSSGCATAADDDGHVAPLGAPGLRAEGGGLVAPGDFEVGDESSHPATKTTLRGGFTSPGDKTSPQPAPVPGSPEPSTTTTGPSPTPTEPSGPITSPDRPVTTTTGPSPTPTEPSGPITSPDRPVAPSGQSLTAPSSASTDDPTTDPDLDEPQPDEPQIGFPFGGGKFTGGTLPTTP